MTNWVGQLFVFVFFFNEKTIKVRIRNLGVQLSKMQTRNYMPTIGAKKKEQEKNCKGL